MKSSYVLLIIGAGLLVAGLVISGVSVFAVTKQVLESGAVINNEQLSPGQSYPRVLKDLPQGRQLLLSLDSRPPDVPLIATVTGPGGDTIGDFNVTGSRFTSTVVTSEPGDHTLVIKNIGSQTVTVSGALLNSPVAEEGGGVSADEPAMQSLITYGIGVLAGIILVIAGIIILIIGAVKYFRSRKTPESVPGG